MKKENRQLGQLDPQLDSNCLKCGRIPFKEVELESEKNSIFEDNVFIKNFIKKFLNLNQTQIIQRKAGQFMFDINF